MAAANKGGATETIPVEDPELLAAFREGRRDALERVYRRHVDEVATFLRRGFMYSVDDTPTRYRGVSDSLELESYVQEVFARAFQPRARLNYDGIRPYRAFLLGVARNLVLDQLRRDARHGEVITAPDVIDAAVAAPRVDSELSRDEQRGRELVSEFLSSACDARDRELYDLRYERDLSQVDAGASAGLTRIQVRRWETKFRARLLRFLKRAGYAREA